jgi:hypothetical protein
MFDPLVFPVSTGQEQTRKSAIATFEAIKLIKENLPGCLTHVGLSNCSFGLNPYTRQVVNSVYLHYALEYGLDSAILHAAKIMPLASIDPEGKELSRRLLFDERLHNVAKQRRVVVADLEGEIQVQGLMRERERLTDLGFLMRRMAMEQAISKHVQAGRSESSWALRRVRATVPARTSTSHAALSSSNKRRARCAAASGRVRLTTSGVSLIAISLPPSKSPGMASAFIPYDR